MVAQLDRGSAPVLTFAVRAARIGRSGEVPLTLSATDPDGDALTTSVQASADGGRTWQPVLTAGDPATVRVSAASLPRSGPRAGRLRVTVADGFDRTVAMSGPLTFAGARTTVRLERGTRRLRRGDDVSLTAAIGRDTGGTVRWFAGRRRVATGPTLALGRLPAGRHRVRATLGAVTSMPVTVVVRARPPLVIQAERGRGCRIRLRHRRRRNGADGRPPTGPAARWRAGARVPRLRAGVARGRAGKRVGLSAPGRAW